MFNFPRWAYLSGTALILADLSPAAAAARSSYMTPAAEAWQRAGTVSYPAMWEWDAAKIFDARPIPATDEMDLTPKVEQYRGKKLIATYSRLGGTPCNSPHRHDNPGTTASAPCGPFSRGSQAAWRHGDVFRVYPAVYRESVYLGPAIEASQPNIAVTAEAKTVTVANTHDIHAGDTVMAATGYLPSGTTVVSVDSPTQITLSNAFLLSGKTGLSFYADLRDVTIEGVTQTVSGVAVRPVVQYDEPSFNSYNGLGQGLLYIAGGGAPGKITNLTIRNIDVIVAKPPAGQTAWKGGAKALVYIGNVLTGTTTFEDMRVIGGQFVPGGAMGFMSSIRGTNGQQNTGTININRVEMADNGGWNGPAHNAYFNEGDYTINLTASWSHDAVYGHLFKSRAPRINVIGNYFQGGLPQTQWGFTQSENYDLDLPCAGVATIVNNVFTKGASGPNSNGFFMTYNTERGICGAYYPVNTIDFHNNTLVAFAKTFDGMHPIYPFQFNVPGTGAQLPGDPNFPATAVTMKDNVFIGFAPSKSRIFNYPWFGPQPAGTGAQLVADFADIDRSYAPIQEYSSTDNSIVGAPSYAHRLGSTTRRRATIGARDAAVGPGNSAPRIPQSSRMNVGPAAD